MQPTSGNTHDGMATQQAPHGTAGSSDGGEAGTMQSSLGDVSTSAARTVEGHIPAFGAPVVDPVVRGVVAEVPLDEGFVLAPPVVGQNVSGASGAVEPDGGVVQISAEHLRNADPDLYARVMEVANGTVGAQRSMSRSTLVGRSKATSAAERYCGDWLGVRYLVQQGHANASFLRSLVFATCSSFASKVPGSPEWCGSTANVF